MILVQALISAAQKTILDEIVLKVSLYGNFINGDRTAWLYASDFIYTISNRLQGKKAVT